MRKNNFRIKWPLIVYDLGVYIVTVVLLLVIYVGPNALSVKGIYEQIGISLFSVFFCRILGNIYGQIWRYGGIQGYIRLLFTDAIAFILYLILQVSFPIEKIVFPRSLSLFCINLLGALALRMLYHYAYKYASNDTFKGRLLAKLLYINSGLRPNDASNIKKIKIAIIGAGRVGVSFAEELLNNENSTYVPRCFVDTNKTKIGREIEGLPVFDEDDKILDRLNYLEIQEVVFAFSMEDEEKTKKTYDFYKDAGYKVKIYDFPTVYSLNNKRYLREFDTEDLLFRKQKVIIDKKTFDYYRDKVVLLAGGGGSIGSELCRQLAKMNLKRLIILDIYENGAYDIEQELKMSYGKDFPVNIEICSITNSLALENIFKNYKIDIVINAAAHKHVPLMEHNVVEAIYNNVFGTLNLVDLCEKYNVERFMMVSTDKAVNPTNVMGATKRMCEMIVGTYSTFGKTKYSSTRFGNVLGSAGSVVPLFKKQIASGGPVTITDKRIIRYFMTIPEASGLVLQSGAMANNGELFVLDMGKPVKIYDLALNMIKLSGVQGIEIVETGLRPGEKLYEELLVKTEELDKTDNKMIFIERDIPITFEELDKKLSMLKDVCALNDDLKAKQILKEVIPTYREPLEINRDFS